MIDDVGQRGAHRVAYLDYYDLTTTSNQDTRESKNNSSKVALPSPSSSSSPSSSLIGLAAIVSLTFYVISRYR